MTHHHFHGGPVPRSASIDGVGGKHHGSSLDNGLDPELGERLGGEAHGELSDFDKADGGG